MASPLEGASCPPPPPPPPGPRFVWSMSNPGPDSDLGPRSVRFSLYRLSVALARLATRRPQGAALLLAETRARGPDGPRMRSPLARRNWHGGASPLARATSSVDGWASTPLALRSHAWSRRRE